MAMSRIAFRIPLGAACLAAGLCAGCDGGIWLGDASKYVQPSVAVMKFENRARFPVNWDLGDGMKDVLVDRLVATKRFHVIERPELSAIVKELNFQQTGATRKQRRASVGRLKNVEYLVKGTITDFGHVSTNRGFLGAMGWLVAGGQARAVMGMTLYVVHVESGEIICSKSIVDSVGATDVEMQGTYAAVAFGGSAYYRTPLGRATAKVIDKAVRRVCSSIARRRWQPKVALVQAGGTVVLNGGKNRRVRAGQLYEVYDSGDPIVDPDTGDVIGHQPGLARGCVRVCQVHPRYSEAVIVTGKAADLRPGQPCRPAEKDAAN